MDKLCAGLLQNHPNVLEIEIVVVRTRIGRTARAGRSAINYLQQRIRNENYTYYITTVNRLALHY